MLKEIALSYLDASIQTAVFFGAVAAIAGISDAVSKRLGESVNENNIDDDEKLKEKEALLEQLKQQIDANGIKAINDYRAEAEKFENEIKNNPYICNHQDEFDAAGAACQEAILWEMRGSKEKAEEQWRDAYHQLQLLNNTLISTAIECSQLYIECEKKRKILNQIVDEASGFELEDGNVINLNFWQKSEIDRLRPLLADTATDEIQYSLNKLSEYKETLKHAEESLSMIIENSYKSQYRVMAARSLTDILAGRRGWSVNIKESGFKCGNTNDDYVLNFFNSLGDRLTFFIMTDGTVKADISFTKENNTDKLYLLTEDLKSIFKKIGLGDITIERM